MSYCSESLARSPTILKKCKNRPLNEAKVARDTWRKYRYFSEVFQIVCTIDRESVKLTLQYNKPTVKIKFLILLDQTSICVKYYFIIHNQCN